MLKASQWEHFWIVLALLVGWIVIQFLAPRPLAPT